jgi:hypothetical protein
VVIAPGATGPLSTRPSIAKPCGVSSVFVIAIRRRSRSATSMSGPGSETPSSTGEYVRTGTRRPSTIVDSPAVMKRSIAWSRPSTLGAQASRPWVPYAAAVAAGA